METEELRPIVEALDRDMACLLDPGAATSAEVARLQRSWERLVDLLALGPIPEARRCPACGNVQMGAATRCGLCWSRLEPAPPPTTAWHH